MEIKMSGVKCVVTASLEHLGDELSGGNTNRDSRCSTILTVAMGLYRTKSHPSRRSQHRELVDKGVYIAL